ncbi:MAG: hypothetical protein E7618_03100 [Ruminococcaceae bacterium]|nr:hypothetical protein [Oscillospiraceae bacterium]
MISYAFSFGDEGEKRAFVNECEAYYHDQIERAADLAESKPDLRFLLLAGPTCSGKTTTANLLIQKLETIGHRVIIVSIDDFFRSREALIADAEREGRAVDLDSVKALDLDALKRFVLSLQTDRNTLMPRFDFTEGRVVEHYPIDPEPEDIYLFEGIQAVYPEVVALFPPALTLRLYISVATPLETPFATFTARERRLLRRLLRDRQFRGADAETTFRHWDGVADNERRNIEPYADACDMTIDSSLPYAIGVMRDALLNVLAEVEKTSEYAAVAQAYAEKLRRFPSLSADYVPKDSVLREFIGE